MHAAALKVPEWPLAQVPETAKLDALRTSVEIEYPAIDVGRVQLNALHPDNAYGPALVQTAAEADPENPVAHAAVTENVGALRTSLEIVYPSIELGLVQLYALQAVSPWSGWKNPPGQVVHTGVPATLV